MKNRNNGRWGRGYMKRNGEVVTPLGTFSEAVAQREKEDDIFKLITLLSILLIIMTGVITYLL